MSELLTVLIDFGIEHVQLPSFSCLQSGSNRKELPLLTRDMDHIFGMAVFGDLLYYTDWLANITAVANIKSGSIRTLSANLYRPGTVLLHHYTSETLGKLSYNS